MRAAQTSTLQRQTDAFRAKVLAMESESTRLLSQTYADALTVLEPRILALSKQIEDARANGQEPGISWLFQQERYQELRRQLLALMDQYGQTAKLVTTEAQKVIVKESLVNAGETLLAVSGGSDEAIATLARGWASVPDESIVNMVGALQDSTPLGQTIASYGTDAAKATNTALVNGLALGSSASDTARLVEKALGLTRTRAEVLVRTETLRASRAASIAAYQQSGVTRGWRWHCAKSSRTCPACLALDGSIHSLDEPMHGHACCRCNAIPVLIDESDAPWYETGAQWFARQPASVQDAVFSFHGGSEAGDAYRAGEVALGDFVALKAAKAPVPISGASGYGRGNAKTWGSSYQATSLVQARKQAEGRRAA